MTFRLAIISGFLTVTCAAMCAVAAPLVRKSAPKSSVPHMQTPAPSGRVIVKFRADAGVRVTAEGLAAADKSAAARVDGLIARAAPGCRLDRRFRRASADIDALRTSAEARSGVDLPDLNTYGILEPATSDRASLLRMVETLLADPAVETAFLEPRYVPAIIGFDAFTGVYTPPDAGSSRDWHYAAPNAEASQDFSSLQTYLGPPPEGVNALAVGQMPGGRGEDVKLVDIELAWLWEHEDLPTPFYTDGEFSDDLAWRNHGTAVMGSIRGNDDGSGVRGVAPQCQVGGASIASLSVPEAILDAAETIAIGDIILLELQAPGPNSNGIGEYGYVPIEYWQDNFDAILIATASGRIVCEAGGNGQQNLDTPIYQSLFDPDHRHSGAILCGAARPDLTPEFFTNYGQRLDLHAWGRQVTTCAFGDLQGPGGGFPEEQWYTDSFSGTSSASAIVAGAVADLQGLARAQLGFSLDPGVTCEVLVATGTPQQPHVKQVGPRPDIAAAWSLASSTVGNVRGRLTDSETSLPIPFAAINIRGQNRRLTTDDAGLFSLNLPSGPITLGFDEYFFATDSIEVDVTPGVGLSRDLELDRLQTVTISGRVVGLDTLQLQDARIWVPGTPVLPAYTREDGAYDLPGLASGKPVAILYDQRPWHGAHIEHITPVFTPGGFNELYVRLPNAEEIFATPAGYQGSTMDWAWGIPTEGPELAFTQYMCWAVGLTGEYANNLHTTLTSGVYIFPDTEQLLLSFHYWCSTESGFDGANLELRIGGEWVVLEPVSGYSHDSVAALGARPGWSGTMDEWRGAVFDLSDQDKELVIFRIVFASDSAARGSGFYIDDISFADDQYTVPVELDPRIPVPGSRPELKVHPNPFNPRTRITWRATLPGPTELTIYDTRGRLVRRLLDRDTEALNGAMSWQGDDETGRQAPSGVYLVRFRDAAGATTTRRVTLMK